jgi:hypothetical protein
VVNLNPKLLQQPQLFDPYMEVDDFEPPPLVNYLAKPLWFWSPADIPALDVQVAMRGAVSSGED